MRRMVKCKMPGYSLICPGGAENYPPIIDDGNTVAWFDFEKNITKDGADLVSAWGDKSGEDNHLIQTVGNKQPLWSIDGILFDGVDDFLRCPGFPFEQPEMIYFVGRPITWTDGDRIFDGNITSQGFLRQSAGTPLIDIYAGSYSPRDANFILNTFAIIRILFNGVNSSLQVNLNAAWNGDAGNRDMDGFILGARVGGDYSNIEVKEIILRKSADDAATQTIIYDYLSAKHGI